MDAIYARRGFTLIELSIVLVIIGLIVGGILVGQDLIHAARVRATATQVEKFNQAVNTFFGKYQALPGDIDNAAATQFGFAARGSYAGEGDGNGLIEGNSTNTAPNHYGFVESAGETVMFWVDLSTANGLNVNLIDGSFSAASPTTAAVITASALGNYFPAAKIGNGNYFYAYSDVRNDATAGDNYYGLSVVSGVPASTGGCAGCITSGTALTVLEAYGIDTKVDDGLPQSGNVIALYLNATLGGTNGVAWAAGQGNQGANSSGSPTTAATAGSATTCYDNSNTAGGTPGVAGNAQHYSIEMSNGTGANCALSFRMQGGD